MGDLASTLSERPDQTTNGGTDLEMTRLCAEAMAFEFIAETGTDVYAANVPGAVPYAYDPLHNDAQAMALVKRFNLTVNYDEDTPRWLVSKRWPDQRERWIGFGKPADLNRAIVECVAKMRATSE